MNVLIIQDHLRGGGTERQSIALARALNEQAVETHLLIGRSGGVLDAYANESLGSRVHFISNAPFLSSLKTLSKIAALSKKHPHLVLLPMGRWANSLSAFIPRKHYRKCFSTIRTSRSLPYLYRRAIETSDCLIANSQWALSYANKRCKIENTPTTQVIYNGLSRPELLEINTAEKATARRALKIDEAQKVLIAVARLDPQKGQEALIRMLAQPSEYKRLLLLLGAGPGEQALRRLTQDLNLTEQVRFLGFQKDLRPFYAAADIALCASSLDSLPNTLIEAHAAGLPAVSYPFAGIPEIVIDRQTGYLVPHGSITDLNKQTERLLANPQDLQVFGKRARKHIENNFDTSQQIVRYINLIRE